MEEFLEKNIETKMKVEHFKPWPKDVRGWNSDRPIFKQLIEESRPEIILEVGTWKGASAITMAKACIELGLNATIYCIDTWLGSLEFPINRKLHGDAWDLMMKHGYPQVYYQFLSNIIHEGVEHMIEPIPATARDAFPRAPQAELIYIDAGHSYLDTKECIEMYWQRLMPNGIIFGDDYHLKTASVRPEDGFFPEVSRAVDEFVLSHGGRLLEVRDNNYWIIRKTK